MVVVENNWCIKQNASKEVCDWFRKFKRTQNAYVLGSYLYLVYCGTNSYYSDSKPDGYTEITLQQFKEYILKEPIKNLN